MSRPVSRPATLHAVVPEGIDDLARPSGGNVYDRRLLDGLRTRGWRVREHAVPGAGPQAEARDRARLAEVLASLPDGSLALAVGDVMGHGLRAAAAMAQIRAATRAYLSLDPDPAAVIGKLDVMFERLRITSLVTLFYAVADLATGTLRFSNAGHYPGLIVAPGADPTVLSAPTRLPLGAGGDDRVTHTVAFGAEDVLVSFTDGLVERRGEVIDTGLDRLSRLAPALLCGRLDDGTADLVARLTSGQDTDDDITVLAVRRRSVG